MTAIEFVKMVAALTPDRECRKCLKDGDEDNAECKKHRPFDMESDDAVESVNGLIRVAREVEPEAEPTEDDCTCGERSWYGNRHDSACPLAGKERAI